MEVYLPATLGRQCLPVQLWYSFSRRCRCLATAPGTLPSFAHPRPSLPKPAYVNGAGPTGAELGGKMTWEFSGDIEEHPELLINAMYCGLNPTFPGYENVCP